MAAPVRRPKARRPVAAEHAARAARIVDESEEAGSKIGWPFVGWVAGRFLALALLMGSAWLVYDFASSDQFQVRSVQVLGTSLLSRGEVEAIAAVNGANVFWIDREAVASRIRALPAVQKVEVNPSLPGRVDIRVTERRPTAIWSTSGQEFLVDAEGVAVMQIQDGQSPEGLPRIEQIEGAAVQPGAKVDPRILTSSASLTALLPGAGVQPTRFEWSPDGGLQIDTQAGWRVRFDASRDVPGQISALQAIRQHLATTKQSAELIDVRFGDRPYYR